MAEFPIRDYRGTQATPRARGMEAELASMRAKGLTLPNSPTRAVASAQRMAADVKDGSSVRAMKRQQVNTAQLAQTRAKGMGRMASMGGDMTIAMDKQREPLQSMVNKGIPFDTSNPEELTKIRSWCRSYQATHHLLPLMIDIYSRFPIKGMEISCKDPQLKQFYEQLFFDELDYEQFLLDFGNEFFTVGEVNSLANFNEVLGVWDNEELLNPEDIIVQKSPFLKNPRYKLRVPEMIRQIIETGEPRLDYDLIVSQYPEFLTMMRSTDVEEDGMDISNILLLRSVNKASPWDVRGTPHMLRCFTTLIGEESLNAAQDAIADRLYSPLIMAKLGSPDLGDGAPWIPDPEELENFKNDMQMALAADFRFMAYHFGIEVENVFGREQMPRLGDDYDRLERKLLQVWGIGESMISGGSGQAAYASSAVNREVCELLMEGFQKKIRQHFKERAEVVAEAQEHFDYKTKDGVRVPEYEEILEVDPDTGEEYVRKRPKLLLPEINFQTMNLRDEATERSFMQELKNAGVPISDQAMMINVPIEFKDEIERIKEEKVQKIVADAEAQQSAVKAIIAQGLPLSPELQLVRQQMQSADSGYPTQSSSPNLPGAPILPGQNKGQQPGGGAAPAGGGGQAPGGGGASGGSGTSDNPLKSADPNSPEGQMLQQQQAEMLSDMQNRPSPPINDIGNDGIADTGGAGAGGSGGASLPRNQITQRPSISDNMRPGAPKSGKLVDGPSVVGLRNKLADEDVEDAVFERRWTASIKGAS